MRIKIQDILPYAEYLDFTDTFCWCTDTMYTKIMGDTCIACPFAVGGYCALVFDYNQHLPQLLTALQAQHPELFI